MNAAGEDQVLCDKQTQALDPCFHPYRRMQVCARSRSSFTTANTQTLIFLKGKLSATFRCCGLLAVGAGQEQADQIMQIKLLFYC